MLDETGCLYHKGRKDSQVKIRGYRVELGEIEAQLATIDGVQAAAVRIHTTAEDDQQLAADLVGTQGLPAGSQLRRILQTKLPAYMVPNSFTIVDRMPVNRNGKIDRTALPDPAPLASDSNEAKQLPQSPLEAQLAAIWQAVLHAEAIGIDENFFDLGGHSLMAVTLLDRVATATGKRLALSAIIQAPTIVQQATLLQQADQSPWTSLVPMRASGTSRPLFLVPPANGTAFTFVKLVRYLDVEQPLYALDLVGLNSTVAPLKSIEAMAAHYISEMRALQPVGPYRIGGQCMGSCVALEMTRLLLEQDCAVETLVILDSGAPDNGPTWQWQPLHRAIEYHHGRLRHFWRRLHERIATWTLHHSFQIRWQKFKDPHVSPRHLKTLMQTHFAGQRRYLAAPIHQHIFLIQSAEYANNSVHQQRWSALAMDGLTLCVVEGATHRTIFDENKDHIATLARYLQEHLHHLDRQYESNLHGTLRKSLKL